MIFLNGILQKKGEGKHLGQSSENSRNKFKKEDIEKMDPGRGHSVESAHFIFKPQLNYGFDKSETSIS